MQLGCCFCVQDRIIAGASHGIASSLTILLAIACLGIYTDTIPEAHTHTLLTSHHRHDDDDVVVVVVVAKFLGRLLFVHAIQVG